jgi:7-carboxy-7-deazaguanine synthase
MSLFITEIFYSIQGESVFNGRPCVFVRLSGCNLRCSYCDTRYAYENGSQMSITDIYTEVAQYNCQLVEITGGEPLIQQDTPELINYFIENGFEVMLETNGTLDTGKIDNRCIIIVDIKCPSSKESDKNDFINLKRLTKKDQIKFVIGTRKDYEYAKNILEIHRPELPAGNILFSPVFPELSAEKLAKWILKDNLNVRLQLQIHKLIWPDKDRGV